MWSTRTIFESDESESVVDGVESPSNGGRLPPMRSVIVTVGWWSLLNVDDWLLVILILLSEG